MNRVLHLANQLLPQVTGVTVEETSLDSATRNKLVELRMKYGKAQPDGIRIEGLNHLALVSSDMDQTCKVGSSLSLRTVRCHAWVLFPPSFIVACLGFDCAKR